MVIIQLILAAVILGVVYVRMLRREVPKPVGRAQAAVPVALGVASTIVGLLITLGFGWLLLAAGHKTSDIGVPALEALASALLTAGLPEEAAKLGMMLLSIKIFRPKNVYEYILIGAAVGFGFTAHEEVVYGGSAAGLVRMLTLALHMVFGVIMSRYLGLARHKKIRGRKDIRKGYVLALAVPVALHTLYDACTVNNPVIQTLENGEETGMLGVIVGCAAILIATVGQVVLLLRVKAKAEAYCGMSTVAGEPAEV